MYTQLLVILGHGKRMDLGYFEFSLFPTTAERSGEDREACTYEMVPAGIFENSS